MKTKSIICVASALALGLAAGGAAAHDGDDPSPDRAQLERELDAKRDQIRELAEEMSRLSLELADGQVHKIIKRVHAGGDRAMLGISIKSRTDDPGVRVLGVTPGGPADEAGLESGDVIVALGDRDLKAQEGRDGVQALMAFMAEVEPGDPVEVTVERDGRRITRTVTTEALGDHASAFAYVHPDLDFNFSFDGDFPELANLEDLERLGHLGKFAFAWHGGAWADMELVELTPELGAYFGVDSGLLVVRSPKDAGLGVVDGDVIVEFNGETVETPRAFTRALRRSAPGDTITLDIVRQRAAMSLEAQVPESPHAGNIGLGRDGDRVVIERRYSDSD